MQLPYELRQLLEGKEVNIVSDNARRPVYSQTEQVDPVQLVHFGSGWMKFTSCPSKEKKRMQLSTVGGRWGSMPRSGSSGGLDERKAENNRFRRVISDSSVFAPAAPRLPQRKPQKPERRGSNGTSEMGNENAIMGNATWDSMAATPSRANPLMAKLHPSMMPGGLGNNTEKQPTSHGLSRKPQSSGLRHSMSETALGRHAAPRLPRRRGFVDSMSDMSSAMSMDNESNDSMASMSSLTSFMHGTVASSVDTVSVSSHSTQSTASTGGFSGHAMMKMPHSRPNGPLGNFSGHDMMRRSTASNFSSTMGGNRGQSLMSKLHPSMMPGGSLQRPPSLSGQGVHLANVCEDRSTHSISSFESFGGYSTSTAGSASSEQAALSSTSQGLRMPRRTGGENPPNSLHSRSIRSHKDSFVLNSVNSRGLCMPKSAENQTNKNWAPAVNDNSLLLSALPKQSSSSFLGPMGLQKPQRSIDSFESRTQPQVTSPTKLPTQARLFKHCSSDVSSEVGSRDRMAAFPGASGLKLPVRRSFLDESETASVFQADAMSNSLEKAMSIVAEKSKNGSLDTEASLNLKSPEKQKTNMPVDPQQAQLKQRSPQKSILGSLSPSKQRSSSFDEDTIRKSIEPTAVTGLRRPVRKVSVDLTASPDKQDLTGLSSRLTQNTQLRNSSLPVSYQSPRKDERPSLTKVVSRDDQVAEKPRNPPRLMRMDSNDIAGIPEGMAESMAERRIRPQRKPQTAMKTQPTAKIGKDRHVATSEGEEKQPAPQEHVSITTKLQKRKEHSSSDRQAKSLTASQEKSTSKRAKNPLARVPSLSNVFKSSKRVQRQARAPVKSRSRLLRGSSVPHLWSNAKQSKSAPTSLQLEPSSSTDADSPRKVSRPKMLTRVSSLPHLMKAAHKMSKRSEKGPNASRELSRLESSMSSIDETPLAAIMGLGYHEPQRGSVKRTVSAESTSRSECTESTAPLTPNITPTKWASSPDKKSRNHMQAMATTLRFGNIRKGITRLVDGHKVEGRKEDEELSPELANLHESSASCHTDTSTTLSPLGSPVKCSARTPGRRHSIGGTFQQVNSTAPFIAEPRKRRTSISTFNQSRRVSSNSMIDMVDQNELLRRRNSINLLSKTVKRTDPETRMDFLNKVDCHTVVKKKRMSRRNSLGAATLESRGLDDAGSPRRNSLQGILTGKLENMAWPSPVMASPQSPKSILSATLAEVAVPLSC